MVVNRVTSKEAQIANIVPLDIVLESLLNIVAFSYMFSIAQIATLASYVDDTKVSRATKSL